MIKSKAVKKFYYCCFCKDFISKPTYESERAECSKCGWPIVEIKEPKSEDEAWAVLVQLAILNHLDIDKLRNVECTCRDNLNIQCKDEWLTDCPKCSICVEK